MSVFYPHAHWQNFNKQAYKQKTGEVKEAHLKRKIGVILIKNQIEILIRKRIEVWSNFISRFWLFKTCVLIKALFLGVELGETWPSADAAKTNFVYVYPTWHYMLLYSGKIFFFFCLSFASITASVWKLLAALLCGL